MRDVSAHLDKISYLRDFAEGVDQLIVTLTSVADGAILWVSDGVRSVLGHDPEDVIGTPPCRRWPPCRRRRSSATPLRWSGPAGPRPGGTRRSTGTDVS